MIIVAFTQKTYAIVNSTEEFYINDYANILDDETEKYIINTNKKLNQQTGAQVVVVTVKNLEGKAIEDYANEIFRNFKIGDKTKNNGVLILLALEDRKSRIEVGYGLEGILPDGKTGRIQDQFMVPYFKNNNWNKGIRNGFNAIIKKIEDEYNINVSDENVIIEDYEKAEEFNFLFFIMICISIFFGVYLHTFKRIKSEKKKNIIIFSIVYTSMLFLVYLLMKKTIDLIIYIVLNIFFFACGYIVPYGNIKTGTYSGSSNSSFPWKGGTSGRWRFFRWRRKL